MSEPSFICIYSRSLWLTLPLEITNEGGLKSMFETASNLCTFWIKVKVECPEVGTNALKNLLPFPACCLCEAGFFGSDSNQSKIRE